MKITIESTTKITHFKTSALADSVPARIWEGFTETGTPVHCFITRISPTIPNDDPRQDEFFEQLQECKAPSVEIQAIPLRMIL